MNETPLNEEIAVFHGRTLFLINDANHLLMRRVGEALADSLREDPRLNRLEYLKRTRRGKASIANVRIEVPVYW